MSEQHLPEQTPAADERADEIQPQQAEQTEPAQSEQKQAQQQADQAQTGEARTGEPAAPQAPARTTGAKPSAAKPTPASVPKPSPAAAASQAKAPTAPHPAAAPVTAPRTSVEEARRFARVTDDGHVFVTVDGAEVPVGQYPDATEDEALAYFARKYDDAVAQVMLLEQRVVAKAPSADMPKTLDTIETAVRERGMVGDIAALETRVENLRVAVENLRADERRNADQLRETATKEREALVAEAEQIAEKPAEQTQWKQSSARMAELFEAWKTAQKSGHRIGRSTEEALWKRFRGARTTFERNRRAYFSKLDSQNAEAKAQKEALISRAEALQSSTDWGATAAEYRKLMDEWKASKRASRRDDDALWKRFRAAQDVFFAARKKANQELDREYEANLKVKEGLLEEARALLPVKNLAAAQRSLNSIRDRWEDAGKVPRADIQRVEAGLRQVEDAVKSAQDEQWRRSNPETKARSNSMLSQLEDAIAELEADLRKAEAKGDQRAVAKAQEALDARKQWLQTVQRSSRDLN